MRTFIVLATTACLVGVAASTNVARGAGHSDPEAAQSMSVPPARWGHMFTGNGAAGADANRLYLYGGDDDGIVPVLDDLWYYQTGTNAWTRVTPSGKSRPGPRMQAGWSCGGGTCVLEDGHKGCCLINETWAYDEAANTWSKVSCTASRPCPSARRAPAMTYDPSSGLHFLFGGSSLHYRVRPSANFDDTYTFDAATRRWSRLSPRHKPSPREGAAAAFVPNVGIVLFGGTDLTNVLCDMFVWTGTDWAAVSVGNSGPCLEGHSIAWTGSDLVVSGGWNEQGAGNTVTYRFRFDANGRSGTWSTSSAGTCQNPIGGTDDAIHVATKMAADDTLPPTRVYFGGTNLRGTQYNNTVECTD